MQQAMGSAGNVGDTDAHKPMIAAVGNSHVMAIWMSVYGRTQLDLPFRISFLRLHTPEYEPLFIPAGDQQRINPKLCTNLQRLVESERPVAVLCFASGAFGFHLSAFNSPRPFDFAIPEREDLELAPGAEIIPYDLMVQAAMRGNLQWSQIISTAVECGVGEVFSVCVPPPVASFDPFLPTLTTESIKSRLDRWGEGPKALRYKMWHVQVHADCKKAVAAGAKFLWPPVAAADEAGFLRREFSADIIHANGAYGHLVLEQLAASLNPSLSKES
jgi:hypothetical protein